MKIKTKVEQIIVRASDYTQYKTIKMMATKKLKKKYKYGYKTVKIKSLGINHDLTVQSPEKGYSYFTTEYKLKLIY